MSDLSNLAVGSDIETTNLDSLGGSYIKSTGLYPCTIDMAYTAKSASGALGLHLHLKSVQDKSVIRQTLWVTTGDKKGNRNYYKTKDDKKFLLPGMQLAEQIAEICAGKPMAALTSEKKMIKLWDYNASAEKPTEADVVSELLNQNILIGLMKHRENRNVKDGNGKYVPTKDDRIFNEIDKVFYPDGFSTTEKRAEAAEAKVHKQWAEKYPSDYVEDNYDPNVGAEEDDSLPETAVDTSGFNFS